MTVANKKHITTIESFHFKIGGYFNSYSFEFKFHSNRIEYAITELPGPPESNFQIKKLSVQELKLLVEKFNEMALLNWKSQYINNMMNGTQWNFKLKYNGGSTKKIYGSNDFPSNFDVFFTVLLDIIHDPNLTILYLSSYGEEEE